jgi:hypothetical protein
MSRSFQLLLDGERVFEERTVRRATPEHSYLALFRQLTFDSRGISS